MDLIGIQEYMGAVLVNSNVRNAMMIQCIDYGEKTENGPITHNKLSNLLKYFPDLKHSVVYQGVILSKTQYTDDEVTSANIGEILGYPCQGELDWIISHPNEESFAMSLVAILNSDELVHILDNRCRDMTNLTKMNELKFKAYCVLQNDELFGSMVREVRVEVSKNIPIKSLISNILSGNVDEYDKSEINNYIWNLGFEKIGDYNFDYSNQIHVGILLTLLTYCDNNPLSPFFPLQRFPEDVKVNELTIKWETELLQILNKHLE